jgi:hypothetical protein
MSDEKYTSINDYVLQHLATDERYQQILSGTHDEFARKQIETTVMTFTAEVAKGLDAFVKTLNDPETRAKFEATLKRR